MADGKIHISWDDVNSPQVDAQLKRQEVVVRAQQHYQQASPQPLAAIERRGATSIWYNSLLYMTVFGLFGGIIGSITGEVAYRTAIPNRVAEFEEVIWKMMPVIKSHENGNLSDAETRNRIQAITNRHLKNPYLAVYFDNSLTESDKENRIAQLEEEDGIGQLEAVFFLLICAGVAIAIALAVVEPIVSQNLRTAKVNSLVALTLGIIGAIVGGVCISILYVLLGGGQDIEITFRQVFARAIGWAGLGAFLAIAPGIVLKSWKRSLIGVVGGAIGGFLGGLLFDPLSMASGSVVLSRVVGITSIGALAGIGTGLIEAVAKTGWLRVTAGLIAGKQFILYRNPTYIGSSPQCEIYLFKDAQIGPRHAAVHLVPGGFDLEDLGSPTGTFVNGQHISRTRLRNNDQVQIGGTCFLFQEKKSTGS